MATTSSSYVPGGMGYTSPQTNTNTYVPAAMGYSAPPTKKDPASLNLDPSTLASNPYSSSLSNAISNFNSFNPNVTYTPTSYTGFQNYTPGSSFDAGPAYQEQAYQAKDYTNQNLPGYDALRSRLNAQYAQSSDQAQDQLNRQFASMGGGPSGALAKQTENLATGMAAKKSQDLSNISFQEEQQKQALNQQEQERAYQSQEAAKGRQFGAYELGQQQKFAQHQTSEQERYGNFQTQQQQQFSDFQRQAQQQFENTQANAQRELSKAGMQVDNGSKLAALDQQWAQTQIDARVSVFNAQLADYTAKHSGGLFGGGGLLGLGIGV